MENLEQPEMKHEKKKNYDGWLDGMTTAKQPEKKLYTKCILTDSVLLRRHAAFSGSVRPLQT